MMAFELFLDTNRQPPFGFLTVLCLKNHYQVKNAADAFNFADNFHRQTTAQLKKKREKIPIKELNSFIVTICLLNQS